MRIRVIVLEQEQPLQIIIFDVITTRISKVFFLHNNNNIITAVFTPLDCNQDVTTIEMQLHPQQCLNFKFLFEGYHSRTV
jgi:hypothetical protein